MTPFLQRWRKLFVVVLVLVVLVAGARLFPVREWLETLNQWLAAAGPIGWMIFFAVYVLAAVFLVPGSVLTLGAGVAFGLAVGIPLVLISATAGSAAAFLVSRYLARGMVMKRFGRGERFKTVDQAVAREGWKIVFMLRLSPVFPYNALNYILGLTGIGFWSYVLASATGMLPATILYVYIGYASRTGVETAAGGSADEFKLVYLIVGLAITAFVTYYVTKLARRALREHTAIEVKADTRAEAKRPGTRP